MNTNTIRDGTRRPGGGDLALAAGGGDELARLLALQAEVRRRHAGRHNEPGKLATPTKIPEGILGAWYGAARRTAANPRWRAMTGRPEDHGGPVTGAD